MTSLSLKIVFIIILSTYFTSCKSKKESYTIQYKAITQSVYASGIIKSKDQYLVFPTISGNISNIYVEENSPVNKGTVLMTIENDVLELNQELSTANAKFNSKSNNRDKLEELYQNLSTAEKKYKLDSTNYNRQKKLWEQGIGSQYDYEQKGLLFESSKSNYQGLTLRYQQLSKQLNWADAQSSIASQISRTQSDDRNIRSRINGKVYDLLKEKGEMVTLQTPVAVLGSADSFYIELSIDETEVTKIKLGQKVYITLESYENQTFEAKITKILPLMNERTRSFTVLAAFTKRPPTLYPNLSVEANILLEKKERALLLPIEFITNQNEVTLVSGQTKRVRLGLKNFEMVEIVDGLKENDVVVKNKQD